MDIEKKYEDITKKQAMNNPDMAYKMIKWGLFFEKQIVKFTEKNMPKAYKELNLFAVDSIRKALKNPEKTAWVNIFTPVEILQCFDLQALSIECFSSFISGFQCEDFFNDCAEDLGIAETLCSYHKGFIGAIESGVMPAAKFAITTSTCCDANVNTMRYVSEKKNIDSYIIDVPYEYTKSNEQYVVTQLKELISMLEEKTGKKFDINKLKEIIKRENASKKYFMEYAKELATKYYPSSLTLQMYMLFASHLSIGSEETYRFYKNLAEDIKSYPENKGINILWIHLLPYYQETLKQYFNFNENYQIQTYEINFDYMEELDADHPLEALARKLICNLYNGPYEKKVKEIEKVVDLLKPDGVINFCHWGCKQSAGCVMQIKEAMRKKNLPMLILDGDCMDRRNCHDGQIKTRLEAFLEMIESQKGGRQ